MFMILMTVLWNKYVHKYRVVDVCNQNYFVGIWISKQTRKKKKKMEYGMSTRRYLKIRLIFNFIWKDYISRPRYT